MNNSLLIKNGLVCDPTNGIDKKELDILVENGIIKKVGKGLSAKDVPVFDAKGKLVTPGFVDMHVHLREPGQEEKETIVTGTMAAAAGGFTSVACMANTKPVADNVSIIRYIQYRAQHEGVVNVFPIGACTKGQKGESLTEMAELAENGAVAFSDDGEPVKNALVMRKVLEYAKMLDKVVISHAEDKDLSFCGAMHEGALSTQWGIPGIPSVAESVAVARDILLASTFGRIHLAHLSVKESIELVRQAKQKGFPVTCETAPHYLTLTAEACAGYNTNAKMSPPLREEADRQALIQGLKDGTIDAIATDHAPHARDDKNVEFNCAANGIVGLETAVPLIYTEMVEKKEIPLSRMIELMAVNPSKILGISKGTLSEGADADITVIDITNEKVVDPKIFKSKGRNTPFAGRKLKGWPVLTVVGGKIVHQ